MTHDSRFDPHGTTILGVRRNGAVALGGDGQVTLGNTVMKGNARKVRRLHDGRVLAGFAGVAARPTGVLKFHYRGIRSVCFWSNYSAPPSRRITRRSGGPRLGGCSCWGDLAVLAWCEAAAGLAGGGSHRGPAAVDDQDLAGHVAGGGGGQEQQRAVDLFQRRGAGEQGVLADGPGEAGVG